MKFYQFYFIQNRGEVRKSDPVLSKSGDWIAVGLSQDTANIPMTISTASLDTGDFTVCFFTGTMITTPTGESKVEELVSGDLVSVGELRAVPVKWIGRQSVSTLFGSAERLMPVRFAAGSLGVGMGGGGGRPLQPHSDLTVTADHAMLVDDVLCEAGALVNGTTITRVPLSEFGDSYRCQTTPIFAGLGDTYFRRVRRHLFSPG